MASVKALTAKVTNLQNKVDKEGTAAGAELLGKLADAKAELAKASQPIAPPTAAERGKKVYAPGNNSVLALADRGLIHRSESGPVLFLLPVGSEDVKPENAVMLSALVGITQNGVSRVETATDPAADAKKAVAKLDAEGRRALLASLLTGIESGDDLPPEMKAAFDRIGKEGDPAG